MKIIHSQEYFDKMISEMKKVEQNIDSLTHRVDNIKSLVAAMNLKKTSKVLENGANDLDDKLLKIYQEGVKEFIASLELGNETMESLEQELQSRNGEKK